MWKQTRKNAISGHQTGKFSIFCIQYLDKRKIRPPIWGDMTDNFPFIALLGRRMNIKPGSDIKEIRIRKVL